MTTAFSSKNPNNYLCNYCDYTTSYLKDYNKHLQTIKHKNNKDNGTNNGLIKLYECNLCCKMFKDRAGLWRHKKKCISDDNSNTIIKADQDVDLDKIPNDKDDIIILLLKQNTDLIKEQADIKQIILELVKNGTNNMTNSNNTINNNSHNKAFNLNFFLNETCKNAMNITEFVDSIQWELEDLM